MSNFPWWFGPYFEGIYSSNLGFNGPWVEDKMWNSWPWSIMCCMPAFMPIYKRLWIQKKKSLSLSLKSLERLEWQKINWLKFIGNRLHFSFYMLEAYLNTSWCVWQIFFFFFYGGKFFFLMEAKIIFINLFYYSAYFWYYS